MTTLFCEMEGLREGRAAVLVVDRDPATRHELCRALEDGPAAPPTLEAERPGEMLALASRAGAVVLSADATGSRMADALAILRERLPDLPVVVVSRHDDPDGMRWALELGASSYASHRVGDGALRTVVSAALAGHPVVDAEPVRRAIDRYERMMDRAQDRDRAIIESLAAAMEAKDTVTSRHVQQVAELAVQLARLVEPRLCESDGFLFGCLLHDVGKIGVPERILNKPGPLTEAEWQVMRLHPETGARVIRPLGLPPVVGEIVMHHHERWDGAGYPAGLAGQDIPLAARVFSVCDALEAMTAPRPYRAPMAGADAFGRVCAEAGRQFDPRVVATLERGVGDESIRLSGSLERQALAIEPAA